VRSVPAVEGEIKAADPVEHSDVDVTLKDIFIINNFTIGTVMLSFNVLYRSEEDQRISTSISLRSSEASRQRTILKAYM